MPVAHSPAVCCPSKTMTEALYQSHLQLLGHPERPLKSEERRTARQAAHGGGDHCGKRPGRLAGAAHQERSPRQAGRQRKSARTGHGRLVQSSDLAPTICRPSLAPKTYEKYELFSRLHIVPHLGAKRLDKLQVQDIQAVAQQARPYLPMLRTREGRWASRGKSAGAALLVNAVTRSCRPRPARMPATC